jgi:hypothetical protein
VKKILVVAQVEDEANILKQIQKQTIQPSEVFIYVDPDPAVGIDARRKRIAENHQKLVDKVKTSNADLIWQLEGDIDIEEYTLELLLQDYEILDDKNIGYVSGIQVGRHGLYCLGAWHVADDRQSFFSTNYQNQGLVRVDATGFYCLLARKDAWLSGKSSWNGEPWGPDVNWGLSIHKHKYVDMDIHVGHITKRGTIRPSDMSTCNARFYKDDNRWIYKQL